MPTRVPALSNSSIGQHNARGSAFIVRAETTTTASRGWEDGTSAPGHDVNLEQSMKIIIVFSRVRGFSSVSASDKGRTWSGGEDHDDI